MKWKEHITIHKEQENWYLQDTEFERRISIDSQYHALVEIIESDVTTDAELIHRLASTLQEKEIIIDCMVAEFYLKYADYLQRNQETTLPIEV